MMHDDIKRQQPDLAQIRAHLFTLFSPEAAHLFPGGKIEIAWTDPVSERLNHAELFSVFEIEQAAALAAEKNAIEGQNVYVGAAMRGEDTAPFGRSTDADFLCATHAWCDLDDGEAVAKANEIAKGIGLLPTSVVSTGSQPSRRAQIWFRLKEPCADPARLRSLNEAITRSFPGSDSGVVNVGRVMRLGGTISYPRANKRARGYIIELTSFREISNDAIPITRLERVYSVAAPAALSAPAAALQIDLGGQGGRGDIELHSLLQATRQPGQWHDNMRAAIASLIGRGLPDSAIRLICAPYCNSGADDPDLAPLIAGGRRKWQMPNDESGALILPPAQQVPPAQPVAIDAVPAFDFEIDTIPPRPWLIHGMLLSGYLGLLVGTGGAGKSLFSLQIATALAAGENWGGFFVRRPARILILNAEDDIIEMRRRLHAIRLRMGIDFSKIGDRFLIANPDSLLITQRDPLRKIQIASPLVPALIEFIREKKIEALIVDPFAETLAGDENASEDIRWVMKIWRDEIARATGCAVLLVHHTPKYSGAMAGDANAARGSGAINAAVRTSWTVFPMTSEEAEAADVEEQDRHKFVRLDDAKANYGLLSGTAKWFEKVNVDLGNGRDGIPQDQVGILAPWKPPGPFKGLSIEGINACLDAIERGIEDENLKSTGQLYSSRADAGKRYVVPLMQERLAIEEERAKRITRIWRESGLLFEEDYVDPVSRKSRKGLKVNNSKRPSAASLEF